MAITRQKKVEILNELIEDLKNAKSAAFTQYAGSTVAQITKLRRQGRQANVKVVIAKKTLIQKAAKENGYETIPENIMDGPIAIAFSPDEVTAAKIIKAYAKEVETVRLVGGLMDGKVLNRKQIMTFADLPSRDELLSIFVGMIQSPLRNFASAISSPLSSIARAFKAYGETK